MRPAAVWLLTMCPGQTSKTEFAVGSVCVCIVLCMPQPLALPHGSSGRLDSDRRQNGSMFHALGSMLTVRELEPCHKKPRSSDMRAECDGMEGKGGGMGRAWCGKWEWEWAQRTTKPEEPLTVRPFTIEHH